MRDVLLILLIFVLYACEDSKVDNSLTQRLDSNIGTNIQPFIQFNDEETERFSIEERMNALNIAGVSIAVAKGKQVVYAKAFGLARKKDSIKVDTKTIFPSGSISKLFTAAIILKMVETGQLELDKPVNQYLTQWHIPESPESFDEKVTIRRLLEHTSGLNQREGMLVPQTDSIPNTIDILKELDIKFVNTPGEKYNFSANNYLILQLLIEKIGESFTKTANEEILDPLGLNRSFFYSNSSQVKTNVATSYLDDGTRVSNSKYADLAGEGLWSTPADMLKYIAEIQLSYQTNKERFFKLSTIEELNINGQPGNHLGLIINEHTFGFTGNTIGSSAKIVSWKNYPYSVAISANGYSESLMNEIAYEIANILGLPIEIKPTIHNVVELNSEQLEKIIGSYKPLSRSPLGNLDIRLENDEFHFSFEDENVQLNPKAINDSTFVDKEGYFHRVEGMNTKDTRIVFWDILEYEKTKN